MRTLSKIIFSQQREFEAGEIINSYQKERGSLIVDGVRTIPEILEFFVDMRLLRNYFGHYSLLKNKIRTTADFPPKCRVGVSVGL